MSTQTQLYNTRLLSDVPTDTTKHYDYFFVACGSDFRAYQVLRKSRDYGISINKIFAFDFKQRNEGLDPEGIKAYESYDILGINMDRVSCSISDPSACVKTLVDIDPGLVNSNNIAIDISCFTKPYFFCLLKYLKEKTNIDSITIFYTEPLSYIFAEGTYRSYHSTSGSLSVVEIPGFPGNDTRTTKKILVVLLGFDGELALSIENEVAPDDIVIITGFPAYSPKFKDISLINNEKLLGSKLVNYTRANNPFETFNLLERLYIQEAAAFFNVAPIGTKPMALGACLFALAHPAVRIIYPFPDKYTNETTRECWNSWSYEIPFRIE